MRKAPKTAFKKGQSGNPAGKPKGAYSPLRRQLMSLRNKAAEKVEEAFEVLWKDFNNNQEPNKQSLAKQIYFKELVSVPKEWLSEISVTGLRKEINSIDDIDNVLAALASKLLDGDSMSNDEVHNLIKTLNNIKFTEQFGKQNKVEETAEEYEARMQDIKLFSRWKQERKEKEVM